MLAINKPSIEYLNLDGLKLYDNVDSLRDKSGNPVFQYRYAQLVLGAGSKLELELHVESIINKYKETFSSLYLKYKDYYNPYENSSDMVSNDIINKVGEK